MSASAPARFGSSYRSRMLGAVVAGNFVPILIATLTDLGSHRTIFYVGAGGACLAPLLVTLVSRRRRVLFYAAAYGGLPSIVMLQAYSGGAASGYSVLLMMAMIWFGLQTSDREMLAAVALLAGCAFLPMLVFGAPAYPVSWGHAVLLVFVGGSVAGSLRMVTRETQRLNARLRREAVMDGLTGLLNRRGWEDAAGRELARAARRAGHVALVLLDLDKLKVVNDSRGHHEGDRILRETGERMAAALRSGDVVARNGGDEFCALLSDTTLDDALAALARLRDVTPELGAFSAGLAAWDRAEGLEDLQRRADLALYAAKAAGGGRTELAPEPLPSPLTA